MCPFLFYAGSCSVFSWQIQYRGVQGTSNITASGLCVQVGRYIQQKILYQLPSVGLCLLAPNYKVDSFHTTKEQQNFMTWPPIWRFTGQTTSLPKLSTHSSLYRSVPHLLFPCCLRSSCIQWRKKAANEWWKAASETKLISEKQNCGNMIQSRFGKVSYVSHCIQ